MKLTKYALAGASLFLLAACETPESVKSVLDGADVYGDSNGTYGSTVPGYDEFVANVGDRVFFATDSSVLGSEAQATLQRQANWLKGHTDVNVVIEGHADERGTREYNLALGERRANAAENYLVSLGVPASRVSTVSYGKERPAVLGHDANAWAQNRRSVTVLAK